MRFAPAIALLTLCLPPAFGGTNMLNSAALADVQAAVTAAATGDMIIFPTNSSAFWSNNCEVTKAISFIGNNTSLTQGIGLNLGFFYVHGFTNTAQTNRINGFNLYCISNNATRHGIYFADVVLSKVRVDHCQIHNGYTQIGGGWIQGVMDHCTNYNGGNWSDMTADDTRWKADCTWTNLQAGQSDAFFFEDNKFIIDADWPTPGSGNLNAHDAYNGGKYVYRFNEFDYDNSSYAGNMGTITVHGNASGGATNGYWEIDPLARRSPSVIEVYSNYMHGKRIDNMFSFRGGAALVFGNTHTDVFGSKAYIRMTSEQYWGAGQWNPLRTQWPAEDQVNNSFFWNNVIDGGAFDASNINCASGSDTNLLQDREFFLHRPATTGEGMTLGKLVWTGQNGGSQGTPTDGVIYPTLGTLTWASGVENAYYGYTPYTYPHPLTVQAGPPPPPPAPVGNFHVKRIIAQKVHSR